MDRRTDRRLARTNCGHARDYERSTLSSGALVHLIMIRLLARRRDIQEAFTPLAQTMISLKLLVQDALGGNGPLNERNLIFHDSFRRRPTSI